MAILFVSGSQAQCPTCKSLNVVRSRRRGSVEYGLSVFSIYPFRCLVCYGRFRMLSLKRGTGLTTREVPMRRAPNPQ